MAKQEEMCSDPKLPPDLCLGVMYNDDPLPRTARCSTCGRRLKLRVIDVGDHQILVKMPAHKKKGWWKRGRIGGRKEKRVMKRAGARR